MSQSQRVSMLARLALMVPELAREIEPARQETDGRPA